MSDCSIGIQVIMPKTGTSPKSTPAQQANEREAATPPVTRQAPPPPGMGKFVDKTA
jgi:hypothetical protein